MKSFRLFFAFAIAFNLSIAEAGFFSGNEIKSKIEDNNMYTQGVGLGYIIGVADSIFGYGFCPPTGDAGIRAGQIQQVVVKYFREHPEKLHLTADSLITAALMQTWPCAKKTPPTSRPSSPKPKQQESTNPF